MRIVEPKKAQQEAAKESGRFKSFLELVMPALEAVLVQYPNDADDRRAAVGKVSPPRISIDNLVKVSMALQRGGAPGGRSAA